jgi:GTPase
VKFIDETMIAVQSGDGGRGCVSFRREKFIPRGGPDGGDGGKGGNVILKASAARRTLYQFRFKHQFSAEKGGYGQGQNKTGRAGQDLVIEIPPGTLVTDADTGDIVHDFTEPEETFIVATGGRGGQGNARFKSSTNRAPRFAQPGEPGQSLNLKMELKLLADVGLVGLPNAGKSTLIRAMSSARPKVGSYPFTTLTPSLGVVATGWGDPFVVADIPGLIEGAHQGTGLGIRFLRHIERTRILVHLIDTADLDPEAPLAPLKTINGELFQYSEALARKPQIVVLNKLDLDDAEDLADCFETAAAHIETIRISAETGEGVKQLISRILHLLDRPHEDQ